MIEAHHVSQLCLPALTTGCKCCCTLYVSYSNATHRVLCSRVSTAHCVLCWRASTTHCVRKEEKRVRVYLTSLFTPLYYLRPAGLLGHQHKNTEMTNVPVSLAAPTIFTKCPQFTVLFSQNFPTFTIQIFRVLNISLFLDLQYKYK